MFGKGIYFSDMVSKSANYCFPSENNPHGFLLLCDVALGNMYERTEQQFIAKLPTGKDSTKARGRSSLNERVLTKHGYEIPSGKPVVEKNFKKTDNNLLYNE